MQDHGGQLHELARRALALLRAQGVADQDGAIIATLTTADGAALEISCSGPDLPGDVPEPVADYQMVSVQQAGWQGAYRLVVRAPLVVFDLCWNTGEPLRIMGFSRGDWESELTEARS
ncbi:MAG: hypothetical protein V3R85_10010 [Alphaproteobacteria bacterium]